MEWRKAKDEDGRIIPRVIRSGPYTVARYTDEGVDIYRPSIAGRFLTMTAYDSVKEAQQVCANHLQITGGSE
jgi:hypothetical protein